MPTRYFTINVHNTRRVCYDIRYNIKFANENKNLKYYRRDNVRRDWVNRQSYNANKLGLIIIKHR